MPDTNNPVYMTNTFSALFIMVITICLSVQASAQKITTKFYDREWNECEISLARFYSTIEQTDSGWFRNNYYASTNGLKMQGLFKDSLCKIKNGGFLYFFANDNLESTGRYLDNKLEGVYIRYHNNGMMADSGYYKADKLRGNRIGWHPNGFMSDSSFVKNDSVTTEAEWFDNGNISAYGYYLHGKKNGQWNYFHKNGKPAAVEINDHGKIVSSEFFNEDGSVQTDTSAVHREATFKKGDKDWINFLSGKIYWPEEYKITNSNTATVVVRFIVDEDGKIATQYLEVPFHYLIDNIAVEAIKKSPTWKPALDHNRRVKAYRRQPLTFTQE